MITELVTFLCLALIGAMFGYLAGVAHPPCVPGAPRGCTVESGALGIQYCREQGFGWESCQGFESPVYPQAKWRSE